MSQKYYTVVTNQGAARIARATALGAPVGITRMAVGDGGGSPVTPAATMTALRREVYRANVNLLKIDEGNRNQIVAELLIPEEEGDFTIREVGLFASDGTLIAVGNLPDNYKPRASSGTASQQIVRMIIKVDNTGAVALKVDPAVILATREYVDKKIINRLDDDSADKALSAKMGKKLQEEKLGNSGDQTISNGILTVGKTIDWPAIRIPSGAGVWEIETNPQSAAAVEGSIRMGFKFVESGQQAKGIIMPALVSGYETVAYQSWVNQRIRDYGDTRVPSTAYNADAADSDFGKSGFFRTNATELDGKRTPKMHIHAAHPSAGKKYSRGIGFEYGPTFDVFTTSWNAEGVYQGMKVILTEENGVMLSGNQTVGGVKTFSGRADFSSGIRIGGSNTEQYSGLFRGAADWYWRNPISGQSLQLKDNGDLAYQNRKIYHEGNKPAWSDIQSKPDVATRGTTLQHYGIADGVTRADFDWAKVPSGTVAYCAGAQPPHGWLAANGAQISRSSFPDLFRAIGTHYGAGNGSTTFHLPDLRGEFLRGWDNGRNVDAGRALGSWQSQNLQDHFHGVGYVAPGEDNIELINRDWNGGAGGSARHIYGESNREVHTPNLHRGNIGTGNAVGHSGEVRPRNIALLAVIKA